MKNHSLVFALATAAAVLLGSCGGDDGGSEQTPSDGPPAASATPAPTPFSLGPIPEEARVSNGGGEPRTAAYWEMWSTCGENSQAEVAAANGGRAAGWILLDDLIADPGLTLGPARITDCKAAVAVLGAGQAAGEIAGVPRLASLLLLAEANLSAGAESCDAVEGVVRVSHALLSEVDFQLDSAHRPLADNEAALATELSDVLSSHSTGELCR